MLNSMELHRPLRRQVAVEGFHDAGLMVGKCQGKTNQKKPDHTRAIGPA